MNKLSDVTFVVVDTETTGFDPETDRIVEIAGKALRLGPWGPEGPALAGFSFFQTLVDPVRDIPPAASAVHHITRGDVYDAPTWDDTRLMLADTLPANIVLVAHNAAFDRGFMVGFESERWLCTQRLAQHLYPGAPGYSNQTLRYYLGIADLDTMGGSPHRALYDVICTSALLDVLLREYLRHVSAGESTVEDLIVFANAPILIRTMPFGKHYGLPLADVPEDYLAYCLRQMTDLNPDTRYSLERELQRRAGQEALL